MTEDSIYKVFQQHIETTMNAGEIILPDIVVAAELMTECLLDGNKILTCGNGPSSALAQILSSSLHNRFERERPSLPAIALGCDSTSVSAISNERSFNEVYAKEIKVLANSGDILVIVTSSGNPSNLIQAVQAAHDKNMLVITLNGRDGGNISSILNENDKEIRVPSNARCRIHELHLLIIFSLCSLIDEKLFGSIEQ
jgi:D-sedoheptulose 7-phosphate isomerase